jgi:hypothetical protein
MHRKGVRKMAVVKSDKYREIGEQVREKLFPHLQGCNIAWLASDEAKKKAGGKTVLADCTKVNKKRYGWCCDYDFMITVYEPNLTDHYFDERKLEILLEHELMHVGYDIETGDCTLVPHNSEEFVEIIRKYGIDWVDKFEDEAADEFIPDDLYRVDDPPVADEVLGAEE